MKWMKMSMCLRRSALTECYVCGWTSWVGLWVVWCHHSHMHSVSAFMLHGPASVSCSFPYLLYSLIFPPHLLLRCCQDPFWLVLRTDEKTKITPNNTAVCSCTNNRCVLWSQATASILRNAMFPTLWHNLAEAILLVVFYSTVNH